MSKSCTKNYLQATDQEFSQIEPFLEFYLTIFKAFILNHSSLKMYLYYLTAVIHFIAHGQVSMISNFSAFSSIILCFTGRMVTPCHEEQIIGAISKYMSLPLILSTTFAGEGSTSPLERLLEHLVVKYD